MFERLFGWLESFQRSMVYDLLFQQARWVDWFTVLFIVLGIIYGLENGLLAEVLEVIQIMAVIFIVFEIYPGVATWIRNHAGFMPAESARAVAYVLCGFVVWGAAAVILGFFRKFFHADIAAPLRLGGGALLGALHLFIIYSFIAQTLLLLPMQRPKKAFEPGASYSGKYIAALAPEIHGMIARPFQLVGDKEN